MSTKAEQIESLMDENTDSLKFSAVNSAGEMHRECSRNGNGFNAWLFVNSMVNNVAQANQCNGNEGEMGQMDRGENDLWARGETKGNKHADGAKSALEGDGGEGQCTASGLHFTVHASG